MACSSNSIKLLEGGEIHEEDAIVAQDFGKHFNSIVEKLDIPRSLGTCSCPSIIASDPILNAILKYENHQSILKIKQYVGKDISFSFSYVSEDTVCQEIFRLIKSSSKSTIFENDLGWLYLCLCG